MKMMKLLTFALAGLAFVSCAKMEPAQVSMEPSNELITFTTPISAPLTKADPVTTNRTALYGSIFPTNWDFDVQAVWYSDGTAEPTPTTWNTPADYTTFIKRQAASYREATPGPAWFTANDYYWPKNGKLAFMAFYPCDNSETPKGRLENATGVTFDYSTGFAVDGTQPDIMYSDLVVNATKTTSTPGTHYNGVQLTFNHALSSLVFTAKTESIYNGVVIKIGSIVLKNVMKAGTYGEGDWTPSGVLADYDNIIKEAAAGVVRDSVDVPTNGTTISKLYELATVNDLLVMPQDFDDETAIEIKYTIKQHNEPAIPQTHTVLLKDLYFEDGVDTWTDAGTHVRKTKFEKGKKYIFNIIIGLEQIYFAPEVIDWTPITAENIKVE